MVRFLFGVMVGLAGGLWLFSLLLECLEDEVEEEEVVVEG